MQKNQAQYANSKRGRILVWPCRRLQHHLVQMLKGRERCLDFSEVNREIKGMNISKNIDNSMCRLKQLKQLKPKCADNLLRILNISFLLYFFWVQHVRWRFVMVCLV